MRSFSTRIALNSLALTALVLALQSPALAQGIPANVPVNIPGLPNAIPSLPNGIPGLPSGIPGLPSGIPGLPDGITGGSPGGSTGDGSGVAEYEARNSFVKNIMNGYVKRGASQAGAYGTDNAVTDKLTLPPLPGEQAMADSVKETNKFAPGGKLPMTSRENYEDFQIRMPTLIGMRQLMDGTPIKEMLKELTTKQVPVLFQTMMMVENGAATGYIGALNATNGILQNTMQSQDLQIKLMDMTDHTGLQKEAYVRRMKQALEDGGTNDAWPAALFAALGDKATEADGAIAKFDKMPKAQAFTVGNLRGSPNPAATKVLLSDLLFFADDAELSAKENLDLLKQDFKRYLGDYELEQLPVNGKTAGVNIKMKRIKPEANQSRRGLARAKWEEQAVVFESLGKILKLHCEFKKDSSNVKVKPFRGKTAALAMQQAMDLSTFTPSTSFGGSLKHSPWEYASSPDIPLSINFVEQVYTLFIRSSKEKNLKCDDFNFRADQIPSMMASSGTSTNLDDCSGNKGCVRNRLLVFYSDVVARSRVLYLYRTLIEQVYKFAVTPELQRYLTQMLREEFGDYDINNEITLNRERWAEYQVFFGKYAQGMSGGGSAPTAGGSGNVPNAFVAGN